MVSSLMMVDVIVCDGVVASASNSAGGMSPRLSCSRPVLNQPTYRELELAAAAPDPVGDQLGLEAVDEALGEGVVVGVADRADRREDAVIGQRLGVVDAGARAAAAARRTAQRVVHAAV